MPNPVLRSCLLLLASASLVAQDPGANPAPTTRPEARKGDELRRAFVDGDGGRRVPISAAAEVVIGKDAAGRAGFMVLLRAIAAVAPPPEPKADPAPGTVPPKPPEFADAVKQAMAAAIGGGEAGSAALKTLAEDQANGPAALRRLDERGKAILARAMTTLIRRKMETNAVFAGQHAELKDFGAEAIALLLQWTKEPPKEVPAAENFRTACVRALRDVVPADQADDALRTALKGVVGVAQSSKNNELLTAVVCALHQFGDPSLFDTMKANVEKLAKSEEPQQRATGLSMLADLHYQLRKYEEAVGHYQALIALMEKAEGQPQNMATIVYNAACSASLAKQPDVAFPLLEKALTMGAKDMSIPKTMVDSDHDMDNLRGDERFGKLMEQFFGKKK